MEEFAWERAIIDGEEHPHTFVKASAEVRTVAVTHNKENTWIVSGVKDFVILKSTGSEFKGFLVDPYTILEETDDRVMATSLVMQWRLAGTDPGELGFDGLFARIGEIAIATFATVHSLALQQTLYRIGEAILEEFGQVAGAAVGATTSITSSTTSPRSAMENHKEVFHADDRPYGLIQAAGCRVRTHPMRARRG